MNNLTIRWKVLLPVFLGLAFLIAAVVISSQTVITNQAKRIALEKAKSDLATIYEIIEGRYPGPWRVAESGLFKGDEKISDNHGLVDWLGDLTGNMVTLFRDDSDVTTSLIVNDKRIENASVSEDATRVVLRGQQEFYGEADVAGHTYQTAYRPLYDANKEVVGMLYTGAPQDLVDNVVSIVRLTILVVSVSASILIALLLMLVLGRSVIRPIRVVSEIIERLSNYDLTFDETSEALNYLKRGDEIGSMTRALGAMHNNFIEIVGSIKTAIKSVTHTGDELSASSQENSATIEEVASTINSFSHTVSGVREQTAIMKNDALAISNLANEGTETMNATNDSMQKIVSGSENVKRAIDQVSNQATQMEKVLKLISDIADQTNLLALNAAIEAARAGEHGRGFAVVADEVRKLAEETQGSVREISNMIGSLLENIGNSAQTMEETERNVTTGSELLGQTQQKFGMITQRIEQTVTSIAEITESIVEMDNTSQGISSASQEQSASMEEVAGSAQNLSKMADDLEELISRFTVSETPDEHDIA